MMKSENAVVVKNLVKSFRIPLDGSTGVKQRIINIFRRSRGYRNFTPLNDISFTIKHGEFFGIVGRNGSGKSTLLKTIAGIYTPDKGYVKVNGTLIPFIELGVGFNPDLTGRENVYLNGALLGFSRNEITKMYNEIVDFAELHDFMEEQLKNYSSGMQVRLAFSIAIRAQGDILLLDEVLAVGDEAFQRKCYDYFYDLKKKNRTVILVTHSMAVVESFCTRAMLIEDGEIKVIGETHKVAAAYSRSNDRQASVPNNQGSSPADDGDTTSLIQTKLYNSSNKATTTFTSGEDMIVKVKWSQNNVKNIGIALCKTSGEYMYATNTVIEKFTLKNSHSASYRVKLDVKEGSYFIKVGLFEELDTQRVDFNEKAASFVVNSNKDDVRWTGLVKLESEWL